jgi:hypothetical protein
MLTREITISLIVLNFFVFRLSTFSDAIAQDNPVAPKVADAQVDLAVPDSPAFYVLGITPDSVVRPVTPRDLAVGLLNGVDVNGNFQTGVAIDSAPYIMVRGRETTLEEYRTNTWKRMLWNTQVSAATTKGASDDDEAVRAALGLRVTLADTGDPRMDETLGNCIARALDEGAKAEELQQIRDKSDQLDREIAEAERTGDRQTVARLEADRQKIEEELNRVYASVTNPLIEKCNNNPELKSKLWNKSGITLGVGPAFDSEKGDIGDISYSGVGVYGSIAIGKDYFAPFGDIAQLVAGVKYRQDELVPIENQSGEFDKVDELMLATRLRLGLQSFNFFGEGAFISEDGDARGSDEYWKVAVGTDIALANDLWLSVGVGGDIGRHEQEDTFILANLKYAFSAEPQFRPAPP